MREEKRTRREENKSEERERRREEKGIEANSYETFEERMHQDQLLLFLS